jgi:putative peptide zinc metalloprotease protein
MTDIDRSDVRQQLLLLTISPDGEEFVLGRADLGNYVAVPEPGAVFVKVLQDGGSLAEAAARASATAGEPVDGADFLDGLAQAGLLEPAGQPGEAGRVRRGKAIGWIEGVSPTVAGALFGAAAWTLYAGCFMLAAALLVWRPDLRPTWESSWFLPDPALCVLTLVPISLLIGACHEAWHWLAGRAVGVPAVFRVSYRGILVVFETDLTQIVTLPRRRRYGAFLAGMALDSVWLAATLVLRLLYVEGVITMPAVWFRLLGALTLLLALSIAMQWLLMFARNDGYAVLANALRCHNLYRTTWLTAKRRVWRLTAAERSELDNTGDRDRSVARWFALVYLAGMIGMLWLLLNIVLPSAIAMVTWIIPNLHSLGIDTVVFWESAVIACYIIAQFALPPLLALRERRLRRSGALR